MDTLLQRRLRMNHPHVVEHVGDRWRVLRVDNNRPFVVAEFDDRERAYGRMSVLNHDWVMEDHALMEAKLLLADVARKASAQHAATVGASWWCRLKVVLSRRLRKSNF
jgi:hypothetical protein